MSNFYTYQNLKSTIIQVLETKKQLQKLQDKIDHLPHPAVLGNSLLKIKDKFEVIKIKNETGELHLNYNDLENITVELIKIKDQLKKLQAKVDNLPHSTDFGDSLLKIDNKFEVIKIKNETGKLHLNYNDLENVIVELIQIKKELQKLPVYNEWFELNSVKFLTSAFKNNIANYFLHTDGEFSFHYWQNPSLITTYKKPEDYVFTQLFGINQEPRITEWSPYIEYDFNANTGEVDFKLASFRNTTKGWIQKTWMVIKTEENDTTFDFKKNPLTFKFQEQTYDVQSLLEKIKTRPSHKEILFNKEVLNITREVAVEDENGNIMRNKKGEILKKQNPNIVESGNTVEIHGYSELIRNTKFVGKTLQFEFVRCEGDEDTLHGNKYEYKVYSVIFEADKLPALDTSTWTKIYKMDSRVQWWIGNRGEIKTEHWDDCVKGAPTIQLKLETSGYYLKFVWTGFKRWWTGTFINFSTKSYWTNFKIIADVYK